MITQLFLSTLRLSTPLLFAALGGILTEKSGIANIALESYLLSSAFASAAAAAMGVPPEICLLIGLFAAVLTSAILGFFCIHMKADQIVVGMALNLFMMGLLPNLTKILFHASGSTTALSVAQRLDYAYLFFTGAAVLSLALHLFFKDFVLGIRIKAAGDNPQSLSTQGVSVSKTRWMAVLLGGAVAGFGGVFLSMVQGSGYIRNMSSGRGFLALAALILGRWQPLPTFVACLFFAFTDAAQMWLQSKEIFGYQIPNQFIQILPYVVCLMTLFITKHRKSYAPKAINS